jgi:hypothetical protein
LQLVVEIAELLPLLGPVSCYGVGVRCLAGGFRMEMGLGNELKEAASVFIVDD